MKSDTNTVKFIGIIGAIFIVLSLFMNIATIHFDVTIEDNENLDMLMLQTGLLTDEDISEESGVEEYQYKMSYGLTMWEMRTMMKNFVGDNVLNSDDKKECLEYVDELESMYKMVPLKTYGIDISKNTSDEFFGFFRYAYGGYNLFVIMPWLILVLGVAALVFSVISCKIGKICSAVAVGGCMAILATCSSSALTVFGVGYVVLALGFVMILVSSIGSFTSPGLYLEYQN